MIYELLPEGRENRITRRELMIRLPALNDRAFYKQLAAERKAGALIASTKAEGGGYWRPKDALELAEYVRDSKSTAISNFASSKAARDAYKKRDTDSAQSRKPKNRDEEER